MAKQCNQRKKVDMNNNKLIAEFMGLHKVLFNSRNLYYYIREFNSGSWYEEHELSYDLSWDWLMPVLKKINSEISPNTRDLWRMIINPTEYHIENVYKQAVEFIKEFNKK